VKVATGILALLSALPAVAQPIREAVWSPDKVLHVPVARGVATRIELEPGETIETAGTGIGAKCEDPEHPWCIAAEKGSGEIYVKPRANSGPSNNLEMRTNRRSYSFQFDLSRSAARRVVIRMPAPDPVQAQLAQRMAAAAALEPRPEEVVEQRLAACPQVVNTHYSVATGRGSDDIVPRAVFDDARFTYLQYPGNREIPAVFQVLADGSEQVVEVRMDCGFVALPLVARRWVVRSGQAVVSLVNEAFDADGRAPQAGTTTEGVERQVRHPRTGQFRGQP
jgi:type IV secretion system protein VirB9